MATQKHGFNLTALTAEKNPHLKRNSIFKQITEDDVAFFKSILPQDCVLETSRVPEDVFLNFTADWYNLYRSSSQVVLLPRTTDHVSQLLRYCNEQRIAVTPQSGNTSASGGSVPVFDEIIISTKHMITIRTFDPLSGALVCDAGCNLEVLDAHLDAEGYQIPLDLPSKHLCRIGGNVSTNAGGIRMMRFGNLHGSVLGLEVVLPDGTILDNLNTNRKDNTGYHLKNLFIGSEGTLGFITGVSILAVRKRPVINVMILALPSFPSVVQAYAHAKRDLSEIIAAFEVMDQDSVLCVKNARAQWPEGEPLPVDDSAAFYCIVETAGSVREHDNEKVDRFISKLKGEGVITDGSIARSKDRIKSFWSWRERLPGTIVSTAPTTIHFDISMPLPILYTVVEDTRAWLREKGWLGTEILAVYGYGHVGDGNLHLTIPAARDEEWLRKALDDFVYEWTVQRNGSISAEHGLGFMKAPYLSHAKPPLVIDTMFRIKALFDPNGIMNPYKVLPSEDDRKIGEGVRKRIGAVAERCGC